jgi:hypothetical protein
VPITAIRKIYVTDGPIPENLGIANINAAGYDPTDRERLYMHYNPAAGKITLNPQGNTYGRANLLGGNYSFDPAGDYLNAGGWDGTHTNPIHPLGSGLDRALTPATGAGGALFGDNLRIGVPRVSTGDQSVGGTIQCPYGFYQYNNVCVPGVNLDPTNPANILGINTGNASYQEAKGVIVQVIPPVRTQKGALFQVVVQIQNIGHKAGKFYVKTSVPSINIAETISNSAFLAPGAKGVIYQSMQMPSTVGPDALMTLMTELWKSPLDSPQAVHLIQDSNQATLPNPNTTLGMPPPIPPIPQFPVSQVPNNLQGYGYPYNPPLPNSGPAYPFPPQPPGFPPMMGGPGGGGGLPPYMGFAARQQIVKKGRGKRRKASKAFLGENFFTPGYGQYQVPYSPYQQYQYQGDPNYNPTPPPMPIYGDASSPFQQNMYFGRYEYPYQYQVPNTLPNEFYGPPPSFIPQPPVYGFDDQFDFQPEDNLEPPMNIVNDVDPQSSPLDLAGGSGTVHIGSDGSVEATGAGGGHVSVDGHGNVTDINGSSVNTGSDSADSSDLGDTSSDITGDGDDSNNNLSHKNLADQINRKVNKGLRKAGIHRNDGGHHIDNNNNQQHHGGDHHTHLHKNKKKVHPAIHRNASGEIIRHTRDHNDHEAHSNYTYNYGNTPGHPYPYNGVYRPTIRLYPHSYNNNYQVYQPISITIQGFTPFDVVLIQVYTIVSLMGTWRFKQKLGSFYTRVLATGETNPKSLNLPVRFRGQHLAIVAINTHTGEKVTKKIHIIA